MVMSYVTAALFLLRFTGIVGLVPDINAVIDELPVGVLQNYTISYTNEYIVSIIGLPSELSHVPPRISVECFDCQKVNPAIIVVKEKYGVISFQLPVVFKLHNNHEVVYNQTERTLCPYEETNTWKRDHQDVDLSGLAEADENSTVIVSLSTSSKTNITLSLEIMLVTDFSLQMGRNISVILTPSSPKFYLYEFTNVTEEEGILEVVSENNNCMILSIQNKSCPVVDTGLMYYKGYFQTVTRLGGMIIHRDMFPLGFYIVLSYEADDSHCLSSSSLEDTERIKEIMITMHKSISTESYLNIVVGTLFIILLLYAIMIYLTFFYFMRNDIEVGELEDGILDPQDNSTSNHYQRPSDVSIMENPGPSKVSSPTADDTLSIKTDSSLDEIDLDILTDAELDKNIFRTKVTLYLSDLAKKNPTVLNKKSELYFWNVMTVAIFYGLPACHLVITYQFNLRNSGNEDLCYYNFLCSHPLGNIFDFNHFFSNIGYVALGFLFLILTHRKEQIHKALLCKNSKLDREYGVPRHCGLYYAMGTSLIIEGCLSACYHICPNIYNFQFDASFMYVISVLCMIKIYQSRHPDVNATAYSTFFLIGFAMFLGSCGVFLSFSNLFWILFTVIHWGTIFYISLHIYYVGRFEFNLQCLIRYVKEFSFRVCGTAPFWCPLYPKRFFLIGVMNMCNWVISISAIVIGVKDTASYLLLIFILNSMLYTTFYIIMKILSGEQILFQPCIYIIFAVFCWSAALYYFFNKTISWKKTPAESRLFNKPCVLFNFYDNHDIWHFISSGGLFFSFMVLLTLDDDLIFVHRRRICVF